MLRWLTPDFLGNQRLALQRTAQDHHTPSGVINRVVDELELQADYLLVKMGPGLGALTNYPLPKFDHLHVVELDRDLVKLLHERYPADRLTVNEGDALEFDFAQLSKPIRLVGNLPYNISTPLLLHFAKFGDRLRDGHFMLQREVVDRMVAGPSSAAHDQLSVSLQLDFEMKSLFRSGPGAFPPPPKLELAIVRTNSLREKPFELHDRELFAAIVSRPFKQQRKTREIH